MHSIKIYKLTIIIAFLAILKLQIFSKSNGELFFTEKSTKYFLGSAFTIGQIEGVAVNDEGIYLSGEKFITPISNVPPKLFFIPKNKLN